VITRLRELQDEMDNYLERTPSDLTAILVETAYANAAGMQFDTVLQALFGPIMVDDVYWFLTEWTPGDAVTVDGVEYTINNLDEFIVYMVESYALE
jgi:hypothetical protein